MGLSGSRYTQLSCKLPRLVGPLKTELPGTSTDGSVRKHFPEDLAGMLGG